MPEPLATPWTTDWRLLADPNLASNVVDTERFRRDTTLAPVDLMELRSLIVIAPHQDDEVIGVGGTMLLARETTATISVIFLTDGVVTDQATRYSDDDWRAIRKEEATRVCTALGAAMHPLGISNRDCRATLSDLHRLAGLIQASRPDAVFVPWLLDSPPKHRYANHLLYLAHRLSPMPDFRVYAYQVHNTVFANAFVDITAVARQKSDLLRAYKSQIENCRRYDHQAMGMAAWNSRFLPQRHCTLAEQYVEIFFRASRDEYLDLVRQFYLPSLEKTYHGHTLVQSAAKAIDEAVRDVVDPQRAGGS